MYIIGNIGYFEHRQDSELRHWQETLARLKEPAKQDSSPKAFQDLALLQYDGSRLGPKLPLWYKNTLKTAT
jgi:hypothetical protein